MINDSYDNRLSEVLKYLNFRIYKESEKITELHKFYGDGELGDDIHRSYGAYAAYKLIKDFLLTLD